MKSTATLFKFLLQTAWIAAVAFAAAFAAALLVQVITTLDPREALFYETQCHMHYIRLSSDREPVNTERSSRKKRLRGDIQVLIHGVGDRTGRIRIFECWFEDSELRSLTDLSESKILYPG